MIFTFFSTKLEIVTLLKFTLNEINGILNELIMKRIITPHYHTLL